MQLAYRHDERPGESYEALDGMLSLHWKLSSGVKSNRVRCIHGNDTVPSGWLDTLCEKVQKRPAHAKPDFNWLSGPRNGTWKRTCGISCLRSLVPMWRFAMQHHPGNIHQSFATPRYSATPCCVLIQLPNVIDTISKRWRSKKAFNTSPCHIFS